MAEQEVKPIVNFARNMKEEVEILAVKIAKGEDYKSFYPPFMVSRAIDFLIRAGIRIPDEKVKGAA